MTFQFRASSKNFYKIIKTSNRHFKTDQNSNHYLPRQYVVHGEDVTRNSDGERHIDFSVTTFGYCDQPQKISPSPSDTNRVFELSNRYKQNDFGSFREKNKVCVSTTSGDFHTTKCFRLKSQN